MKKKEADLLWRKRINHPLSGNEIRSGNESNWKGREGQEQWSSWMWTRRKTRTDETEERKRLGEL
jgi:hypothetical protein